MYNYYLIEQQYDPKEETFRPYTFSIIDRSVYVPNKGWRDKSIGYGTLEEAKKVLEKIKNNYEIEIKAENEYEEKLALAKGEDYQGQGHAMKYSIYRMSWALSLK